jgi:type IX secretion system substrate protein
MKKYLQFILPAIILLTVSSASHAQIITTIAGTGTSGFSGDGGPATDAQFEALAGVAVDKWGNIYVGDWLTDVIHRIDTNGIMTRFAGTGAGGSGGDGGPATNAQLDLYPEIGLAVDIAGNVYISAEQRIRMVNTSGIITTVVGNGILGNSGDAGPATAAKIGGPTGICFDKAGNMYFGDDYAGNDNIRMVNTAGIISTIAGTATGHGGDGGPATDAQLTDPEGIATDDSGNIYFTNGEHIRKINSSGIISTIAGSDPAGMGPDWCDGCPATMLKLSGPTGLTIDHSNNIYFSNITGASVLKITINGSIYTLAGSWAGMWEQGYSGDGGPATNAELHAPMMICFDNAGNLLIVDRSNFRLRKVSVGTTYTPSLQVAATQPFIYPNPTTGSFTVTLPPSTTPATITITNLLGSTIETRTIQNTQLQNIDFNLHTPPGAYIIQVTTGTNTWRQKIEVW